MEKQKNMETGNPLGELSIPKLLLKFTVPSIIAMLTSALYNIVDQFFIGNSVGELGNAATNIAFPLTTCCLSIALLFGIGGASAFNLAKGREEEDAVYYMGNALMGMVSLGCILLVFTQLFLSPMLYTPASSYTIPLSRYQAGAFCCFIQSLPAGRKIKFSRSPLKSVGT